MRVAYLTLLLNQSSCKMFVKMILVLKTRIPLRTKDSISSKICSLGIFPENTCTQCVGNNAGLSSLLRALFCFTLQAKASTISTDAMNHSKQLS